MALFFSGQKPIITHTFDEHHSLPSRGTVTINVINKFDNVPEDDRTSICLKGGNYVRIPKGHYRSLKNLVASINASSQASYGFNIFGAVNGTFVEVVESISIHDGYVRRLLNPNNGLVFYPGLTMDASFGDSPVGSGIIASVLGVNVLVPWSQRRGQVMTGKTSGIVNIDWSKGNVIGMDVNGKIYELDDAAVVVDRA